MKQDIGSTPRLLASRHSRRFVYNARFRRLTRSRINFEEEQLQTTQARLDDLDKVIQTEGEGLANHEQRKQQIEAEIRDAEANIGELKEDLAKANEDLESRTTEVEQAKKVFNKAARAVDQVLKDIVTKVRETGVGAFHKHAHCHKFRTVKSRSSV